MMAPLTTKLAEPGDLHGTNMDKMIDLEIGISKQGAKSGTGLAGDHKVMLELQRLVGSFNEQNFDEFPIPFRAVTTDLNEGEPYVIDHGDLAMAIVQAFPDVHVTIVDQNQSSLLAGREYYASMLRQQQTEQPGNMHFVCANFEDFCTNVAIFWIFAPKSWIKL